MKRHVTTTYLEMTDRAQHRPAESTGADLRVGRAEVPCPELNRFFYTTVGARWWWRDRLAWDDARWFAYLDRPELATWVAYVSGTPAGYFELERQEGDNVEIAYLGLLPSFIGKRLGGPLLSAAIAGAWDMGARRVWVHTCTLDHPQALRNYLARGFTIFLNETKAVELPDGSPGSRLQAAFPPNSSDAPFGSI